MMIRAYDEDYVVSAQRILGDMMDFAINTLEYDGDTFFLCLSYPAWRTSLETEILLMWLEGLDVSWREKCCGKAA